MKYKFSAIITFIAFFACVDHYDIESFSEIQYEPYSNLGFEDGLEHWHGQANTFSSISIDSDAFEGINSLKISINSDSSSQTENFDQSLAEISKSLDVYQGEPNLNPGYLKHKSAFILPHLGSASKQTRTAMGNLAIDNIDEFFKTGSCKNKVN